MKSIHTAVLMTVASLFTGVAVYADPTTKPVEIDRDTNYTVVHNPDGSTTVTRNTTATNENNGKTATRTDDVTVTKTDDGHAWTRETEATGPNGKKIDSTTEGQSHRTGDGGVTWDSHTDGTVTSKDGSKKTYDVDRTGSAQKTETGGEAKSTRTVTGENGRKWVRDRNGKWTREGAAEGSADTATADNPTADDAKSRDGTARDGSARDNAGDRTARGTRSGGRARGR